MHRRLAPHALQRIGAGGARLPLPEAQAARQLAPQRAVARALAVPVRLEAPALERPRRVPRPWRGLAQAAERGEPGAGASDGAAPGGAESADFSKEGEAEQARSEAAAEDQPAEEAAARTEDTVEEEKPVEEAEEARLQRELTELQEKLKAKKHELLLALADFENNKKRFTRERESRRRAATTAFAGKMVDVYAEFEDLVAAPRGEASGGPAQALGEGVVLTRDLYRATLEKFDLKPLPVEPGEPFVPARHECDSDEKATAGAVTGLVRPGWVLESSGAAPVVVRKALVKVAAPGAPPPPPE